TNTAAKLRAITNPIGPPHQLTISAKMAARPAAPSKSQPLRDATGTEGVASRSTVASKPSDLIASSAPASAGAVMAQREPALQEVELKADDPRHPREL